MAAFILFLKGNNLPLNAQQSERSAAISIEDIFLANVGIH
jgi:hypothetical protein